MDTIASNPRLSQQTRSFIGEEHKLLINGQWVPAKSGKTFPVIDPSSGQPIARVAEGDAADIDEAVKAARTAFEDGPWSTMKPSERGKLLYKLAELLERDNDHVAEIESVDNGKPFSVAKVADVPLAADMFRYMAGWTTKIRGTTISLSLPGEYHSYTLKEPIGVVGQIIPWNFPLLMAAWKLAPALATGCTVVLKVAEQTPLSALRLGQLFQEAGFPPGVVNIITGFGATAGAALSAHPRVDKVAFTGSTEVGKMIVQAAAGNLKRLTLELGGKSPAIVFPDADLSKAIPGAANAIFFNHGQCCAAGSRLFAHQNVFDELVAGMGEEAKKITLGPGIEPDTKMGPLVSEEQFTKVRGFIESGQAEGARIVAGGKTHGDRGYFIEPTVLTDTKPEMKVVREEIFGPVVCAMPFSDDDLDRIAKEANDTAFGLAASIWTTNLSTAHRMAARLRSGTVWINCHNVFDAALPFGGYKESGWGREMGEFVLDNYLEVKAVTTALS